jgi:hypothetical protein
MNKSEQDHEPEPKPDNPRQVEVGTLIGLALVVGCLIFGLLLEFIRSIL